MWYFHITSWTTEELIYEFYDFNVVKNCDFLINFGMARVTLRLIINRLKFAYKHHFAWTIWLTHVWSATRKSNPEGQGFSFFILSFYFYFLLYTLHKLKLMVLVLDEKVLREIITRRRNNRSHFGPKGKNGVQNVVPKYPILEY